VKAVLREKALLDTSERRSESSEQLAIFDALTGVANRRYLDARLPEEVARAKRYGRSLSVLMIDIDDFKQINEREGNQAGDRVIVEIARILRTRVREVDFVARYGGEEFVVMLPETPLEGALVVARRLCERIAALPVATYKVTISIGVATGHSADVLVRADAAMYRAKRAGKNRAWPWESGESTPGGRT